jgi:uridine monophosphate synthetase
MSVFFDKLEVRIKAVDSLLCIGLDPHVGQLTEPTVSAAIAFCMDIIQQTHPFAAAFKPNSAFFEAFGAEGVEALHVVLKAIPSDIPVVLDVKRGDIDTTAQAYAEAALKDLNVGCVTLSPYMGLDSIRPFVTGKYQDRAAFVLCKTSNPSSKELQEETLLDGSKLYERVAALCASFNSEQMARSHSNFPSLGLVVGATDLDALRTVRKASPESWILCPGVGAQGGEADV